MSYFTKEKLAEIQREVQKAIVPVAEKHGFILGKNRATYTTVDCTMRIQIQAKPDDGTDPNKAVWDQYAHVFMLDKQDHGREFYLDGHKYTLTTIKPRNHKKPIITTRDDGQRYKFSPEQILAILRQ